MSWTRRPPVQRSSESFAALAAALAKAQAHLVNPEKSLAATVAGGRPGEAPRSFRYAPLSSGLEIVRKTLSEHEIAVIQTTAVDQASRMLNLTTLLAHSSGEWIASYWPVCSVAEIANPHRMGTALTYARRYALFTLVEIAGEDDLDAPDLCMPVPSDTSAAAVWPAASPKQGNGRARRAIKSAGSVILPLDESAALRDRLLAEVVALETQEGATKWAREALPAKNNLTAVDAKMLEDAFGQKMASFAPAESLTSSSTGEDSSVSDSGPQTTRPSNNGEGQQPSGGIDKSVLAISAPRRYRSREHLLFVSQQPCLFCGRKPSDPHHLRYTQPRALGRKASDEFAVPLCRTHHRAAHDAADEQTWWKAIGIDPVKVARKLWKDTVAGKRPKELTILQGSQTNIAPRVDEPNSKAL
jgi:hypothetical protein